MSNKLIILFTCFQLFCSAVSAQLPDESIAPDFTVTDINGNTHHLYGYLNQGKTVVLHFSATWCQPCWDYHHAGTMNYVHNIYGPGGNNSMVMLFIETAPETTLEDLQGTGLSTLGDWVTGQDYPIINDLPDTLDPYKTITGTLYGVNYIPTIYIIGPNRKVVEDHWQDGYLNHYGLHNLAESFPIAHLPKDAGIFQFESAEYYCKGTLSPQIRIQNLGLGGNLQHATIVTKHDGNILNTDVWNGDLPLYETTTVQLSPLTGMNGICTLTFEVSTEGDTSPDNGQLDKTIYPITNEAHQWVNLRIQPDKYPEDISWEIRDYADNLIASGSDYPTNDLIESSIDLGSPDDCFYFTIHDSYGDGLTNNGFIQLLNADDNSVVFEIDGDDYTNRLDRYFATSLPVSAAQEVKAEHPFAVFPNPASDVANLDLRSFALGQAANLSVRNALGQLVFEEKIQTGGIFTLPTKNYPAGKYWVNVVTKEGVFSLGLVVD